MKNTGHVCNINPDPLERPVVRKEEEISNDIRNASGCVDTTAYKAIKNISNDEKKLNKLLHTLFYIIDISGYELEGRITLVDKKTGKIWR